MGRLNETKTYRGISRFFLSCLALSWVLSLAMSSSAEDRDPASHRPVLEDSFTVSSLWGGEILQVFVQGSDPAGDMKYIWAEVTQLGAKSSSELVYLKGEDRKAFSGYLALYTPRYFQGWQEMRLELKIRDAAGNYSNMRTHELRIGAPTRDIIPGKWREAARHRIGTIFFEFERPDGEGFHPFMFRGFGR